MKEFYTPLLFALCANLLLWIIITIGLWIEERGGKWDLPVRAASAVIFTFHEQKAPTANERIISFAFAADIGGRRYYAHQTTYEAPLWSSLWKRLWKTLSTRTGKSRRRSLPFMLSESTQASEPDYCFKEGVRWQKTLNPRLLSKSRIQNRN